MIDVELMNLSISHTGSTASIAAEGENSNEWKICNRWFETARLEFLASRKWKFARKTIDLTLVEEDPTTEWSFSYRYPADCVEAIKIAFYSATGSAQFLDPNEVISNMQPIPFDKGFDDNGQLIYSHAENAQLQYTADVAISYWPAYMRVAFSYLLATYIYKPLCKEYSASALRDIKNDYTEKFDLAAARDDNEIVRVQTNQSPMSLSRR